MPCYVTYDKQGNKMFITGNLGSHCAECCDVAANLCDFPVGDEKTCDRQICNQHSNEIAPNVHYCTAHFHQWENFRKSGGVKNVLENVVPFKGKQNDR